MLSFETLFLLFTVYHKKKRIHFFQEEVNSHKKPDHEDAEKN